VPLERFADVFVGVPDSRFACSSQARFCILSAIRKPLTRNARQSIPRLVFSKMPSVQQTPGGHE
jgi:hypothetical protein